MTATERIPPKARILLADNNADMRDYIQRILSYSYTVQTVADGIAALNAVQDNPPDLVLTDVMMSGMDGVELLRSLRANPNTQLIPIILLSARAGAEARIEGLEAEADDYLIKPFSARELIARVEASLKLAQLRRTAQIREQALHLEAETVRGRLEQVLYSLRDGFLTLDRDWRYTYINDRQTEIIGMSRKAVMGKNVWELFPDLLGTEIDEQLHQAMNDQISVQFEFYYPAWDRWFENRVYPTGDGIAVLCAEITDRKRAKQELRLYADVVENTQVGIVVWQLEDLTDPGSFRLLIANAAASDITGVDFQQLIAQRMADCFPGLLQTPLINEYVNVIQTEQAIDLGEVPYSTDGVRAGVYTLKAFPLPNRCIGLAFENVTTRKQLETALSESEERFRRMAETIQDVFWISIPAEQRLLYVSPAYEKVWGRSREGVYTNYQEWIEAIHPEDQVRVQTSLRVLLQTGEYDIKYRIVRPDGSIRWVRDRGFPIEEATGGVCRVTGIAEDITDRKSAEEALCESEERFRDMADNAPVMVWVTDPTAYCTYLNKSWYDFSGQTEETGLGFGWLDAVHPQDYENSKNIFLAANERHEAFRLEYRLRRKDGEYRWAIDAASPWFGLDGQFKGYIGSVIDITDRKHAEITVREAEARLRLALESAELGTWDLNPITGELKWDNCCKAMFGLSPDAAVNYDVFLAGLHPDDRDRTQAAVEQATNQASNGEYDIEYRTVGIEDGVERWIAAKGKAVFNQAGEAVRFIGTVLNVTEKKRAEAEREHLLQREQAAREQAETANRIKDEFLAVLSHELRSPLNPILGWSSMLQRGRLDAAKTTQALATIERNAKLQVQLIDDLLDISRILRGKLTLTVAPVELSIVISSALETVRLAAEAKSLQIQTLSSSIGLVSGDSGRLQQVVWNLLSNAVKFTPVRGQVTIELTQVKTYAQIQVKDTGKGIHPNFLPHVFEHFRQEDGATTRKFGGLGLGLAIVRQIVEMHGGTVFASSPGEAQGATFTVQIPLAHKSIEMPSTARSSAPTCDLSGIRVLVVDDDVDSREFIAFVLEQENAIVTAVSSGADALQAFSQSIPNIVMSDIGMPEIDGYMLIRQIRMLPPERGGCVPASALTAYAGELDRQQALSAGFQRHIAKPIDSKAVVECVVELVRRRK